MQILLLEEQEVSSIVHVNGSSLEWGAVKARDSPGRLHRGRASSFKILPAEKEIIFIFFSFAYF